LDSTANPIEIESEYQEEKIMTKVAVADDLAAKIRNGEGPIELVDATGQTIGVVRRPPTDAEIERAKSRASRDGKRLSWAQLAAKVKNDGNA